MKQLIFLAFLSTSIFFMSCSEEKEDATPVKEVTPLIVDFTVEVTGESPNAKINIINKTTGASTYAWTFGEGASLLTSTDENPGSITVDKAGDIMITLLAKSGNEEKDLTKTISVAGASAIVTYSDLEFGLDPNDATYGQFFSFETGKVYKSTQVNSTNGSQIHLAFGSLGQTLYYFESASEEGYEIPEATETKVTNFEATPSITVDDFDTITDDTMLADLAIQNKDDSFGNSSIPGTVLFELANGRKGVIKTKLVNSARLLVDIKVQKY